MNSLSLISPIELTLLAVLIGFIAIASLDSHELNVIGNWLIGVGGLMIIASSQQDYLESLKENKLREELLAQQVKLLKDRCQK